MTQIFTLNIGSSTVKLDLFDDSLKKLKSESYYHENQWEKLKSKIENFLNQHDLSNIVTAHRVVHGGQYFKTGTAINQETQDKIKELIPLAPLHQPYNLKGIEICQNIGIQNQYACFDTAAFNQIPAEKSTILVPTENIRKYGFHGLNHAYLLQSMQDKLQKEKLNGIQIHLGNGCSLAQIHNGKITDTSMSYTPLAGISMFSRPGDLDPGIILKIVEQHGLEKSTDILNKQSGIKALVPSAKNIKEAFELQSKDPQAKLALNVWYESICKYLSFYKIKAWFPMWKSIQI